MPAAKPASFLKLKRADSKNDCISVALSLVIVRSNDKDGDTSFQVRPSMMYDLLISFISRSAAPPYTATDSSSLRWSRT